MFDNQSYQDLTDFLHGEFSKIFQTYGVKELPKKYLSILTSSILKRYNLINKLEVKKVKYNIKVEWAKFTMPHGFIWKIFHKKLWCKVKSSIEEENNNIENEEESELSEKTPEILSPVITSRVDISAMSYPSSNFNNGK